ncbi:hypothetical protein V8G54_013386 [Vigna mungo]|uniref:Uncharacterized protein n=1 Tax=Vigna mungo TaxID=3915 RepID=A0AAQ3NUY1_VIGMU
MEEVKLLGFNPLKVAFAVALEAKSTVSKPIWDAKVHMLKKWGKEPKMMLCSMEKLDIVTRFWVGRLRWDRSTLIALEKRLVPRALVLQHLLSRGLVKKDASFVTLFIFQGGNTLVTRVISEGTRSILASGCGDSMHAATSINLATYVERVRVHAKRHHGHHAAISTTTGSSSRTIKPP